MNHHLNAAARRKALGDDSGAPGMLFFGRAAESHRTRLQLAGLLPNTKACREAGLKPGVIETASKL